MSLKVVFRRAAQAEFDAAALRYDMQQPGLGAQLVSEIERAVVWPPPTQNALQSGTPRFVVRRHARAERGLG